MAKTTKSIEEQIEDWCKNQFNGEKYFGLPETSSSSSSRLIREAIGKNLIKILDPNTAPRYMKYIPIWA